jgi:two-component system, OmpR family, sensor histidine kinase CpxA
MAFPPPKWTLSRKILLLALLNLAAIAVVLAVFAERQFGLRLESLLLGPARDRILAVANAVARDLDLDPYESRREVLDRYAQRYSVEVHLVSPQGNALDGVPVQIPQAVIERMDARPETDHRANRPRPWEDPQFRDREPGFPPPDVEGPRRRGPPGAIERRDMVFLVVSRNPWAYWVGARIPTKGPTGDRGVPAILLLRANSILNTRLFFDWRSLLWLALALIAASLVCWWPFLHGIARAIREMDRATEQIARGSFDRHVTSTRRDELGHLGEQINRMAVRLEGLVKNQKRFLGDISHELCAPIARIQFAAGILEQKIDQTQMTHLAVLREEVQEMSSLVNELLMFSKAGVNPGNTPLKRVDLGPVVQRAAAQQLPGAGAIEIAIPEGLSVAANEPYLARAISNLLRNALRYAGEYGPISVIAWREGQQVLLSFADRGPGLPEGLLEDVFAPFYRPEIDRGRDSGGAGLGLAIVRGCVEACHGTAICRNRQQGGLEVLISLSAWTAGR